MTKKNYLKYILIFSLLGPTLLCAQEEAADLEAPEADQASVSDTPVAKKPIVIEKEAAVIEKNAPLPPLKSTHPALRPLAKTMRDRGYEAEYLFSRFASTSHIDESGNESAYADGTSFAKNDHQILLRYGLGHQLEGRIGGIFRQIISNNGFNDVSTNGAESVLLGVRYGLNEKNWFYTFDFEFKKTSYETADYNQGRAPLNEIVLGDDGSHLKAGLQISFKRTAIHVLNFSGYFQQPGRGLSSELPLHADTSWGSENFLLALGVDGIVSLKTDLDDENLSGRPARATAPTELFNSVNRETLTPYVGIKIAWDKWGLGLSYGQMVRGTSTDKGSEIKVSVSWNNVGDSEERVKEDRFKEYSIEAQIIKVSPRGLFVKIDHGLSQEVEKGTRFDIYRTDYFGENVLIAQGVAYEVSADSAILKITKTYRDVPIQKGFSARAE